MGTLYMRSLLKHMKRAVHSGVFCVEVHVAFSVDFYAVRPSWSPGPGFLPCIPHRTWRHGNTAVIETGGHLYWVDIPEPDTWPGWTFLWDKPHRVKNNYYSGALHVRSVESLAGHPLKDVQSYWEAFNNAYGFVPPDALLWYPDTDDGLSLYKGLSFMIRNFGARVSFHPLSWKYTTVDSYWLARKFA